MAGLARQLFEASLGLLQGRRAGTQPAPARQRRQLSLGIFRDKIWPKVASKHKLWSLAPEVVFAVSIPCRVSGPSCCLLPPAVPCSSCEAGLPS